MILMGVLLSFGMAGANEKVEVGRFSAGDLSGWESKRFEGDTRYRLIDIDGLSVLKAESQASASGLYKKQRIDLFKTPYLNWRWRIMRRLSKRDELEKSGDDYVARVYVVVSGGWAFWKTRAINYVWSGNQAKGMVWPNAFAGDHAMMMALRDRRDSVAVWYRERRNVLEDLQRLFGERIRYVDAVALMTDSDNGGGQAESLYGDIYFSER
ncbi:DUF3047 domain-containing protein [Methylomarinum sp. Ch1-1]|uniref:DUF3047 domain-containing protein n=1 Tax=Methylomarinum roseum TaxID=3067653 RepID=A0AAU7NZZ1_9GAMM|nr:DUF3047 domain-containing protein [Methylomarinum sp. Ch1-1]MDP4519894.1 DUF3047 domain-containing protein [Methylomarinum sp. Ch1-1]